MRKGELSGRWRKKTQKGKKVDQRITTECNSDSDCYIWNRHYRVLFQSAYAFDL